MAGGGISLILWAIGLFCFIIAMILVILAAIKKDSTLVKKASVFTIGGEIVFALSIIFQYGFLLIGQSGICHPCRHPDHFCYRVVDVSGKFEPGETGPEITGMNLVLNDFF